jgi:polyisoprenoid-binding protein YceI
MVPSAWSAEWVVLPQTSELRFVASLEGDEVTGAFRRYHAALRFDPDELPRGHFDVSVDLESADTGSPDIDQALQLPDWFDSARHPQARFTARSFRSRGDGFEALGTLSIKGISRELVLPFRWRRNGDRAVMEGTTVLRRTDFRLGEGDWASPDLVGIQVRIDARLSLQRTPE